MVNPKNFFLLAIIVIILWPSYITLKVGGLPSFSPDRLMLLGLAGIFFVHLTLSNTAAQKIKSHGTFVSLIIIYFVWCLLSSLTAAQDTMGSFYSVLIAFFEGPFLALYILMFFRSEEDFHKLIGVLVTVMFLVNIVGLIEYYRSELLFKNYLITVNEFTLGAMKEIVRDGAYRIRSVFINPLVYAQLLITSIPLMFYMLRMRNKSLFRLLMLTNIAFVYFLLYQTGSRAGLALGLAMPLIFNHFYMLKKGTYRYLSKLVIYLCLPLGIVLSVPYFTYAFDNIDTMQKENQRGNLGEEDVSTLARGLQMKLGMEAIVQQPVIGYGYGEGLRPLSPLKSIDNYYLSLLLSTGIVGLAMFIYIMYWIMMKGIRNIKLYRDSMSIYLLTSFVVLLMYYLILSINKGNNLLFTIAAVLIIRSYQLKIKHREWSIR